MSSGVSWIEMLSQQHGGQEEGTCPALPAGSIQSLGLPAGSFPSPPPAHDECELPDVLPSLSWLGGGSSLFRTLDDVTRQADTAGESLDFTDAVPAGAVACRRGCLPARLPDIARECVPRSLGRETHRPRGFHGAF